MLRQVDNINGTIVQKVVTRRGKLICFQYGKPGEPMTRCRSLGAARQALGGGIIAQTKLTAPKSSYPHNQPGYRADSQPGYRGK